MKTQADMFAPKEEPTFLRQAHGDAPVHRMRTALPPPNKTKAGRHAIFANAGKTPPRPRRVRQLFMPELIDRNLFLVDPVRPYPEWPLICLTTGMMAFGDEARIKSWFALSAIYEKKVCDSCGMIHVECYPREMTGTSSGKGLRKDYFLRTKGIDV